MYNTEITPNYNINVDNLNDKMYVHKINKRIRRVCNRDKYKDLKIKKVLADKLKAKKIVRKFFPDIKIAKLIYASTSVLDIVKNLKPNTIVKCNEGSKKNIVIKNVNLFVRLKVLVLLIIYSMYTHGGFSPLWDEPQYMIKKVFFLEEYLGDNLIEYKFFAFNGKIKYCYKIDKNRYTLILRPNFLKIKNFVMEFYRQTKINFIRVDFFRVGYEWYFSEFTFTPFNCKIDKLEKRLVIG